MDFVLECKEFTKKYGSKVALDNVSLNIERGKIIGLLGPNGSGKTTLIKCICGLLVGNSGEIKINGLEPSPETKKVVAYLPDKTFIPDWMNATQMIKFFKDFYDNFNEQKALKMLESLNINLNDKLKTMSKGTKEKVHLIMVMARDADIYLLDEPIAGVDPAARDYILDTIISNHCENSTVIISTHLIADIENVLDSAIFIKNGVIERYASVDSIREVEGKSVDEVFREVYKCIN